jgi:hypothetical protein
MNMPLIFLKAFAKTNYSLKYCHEKYNMLQTKDAIGILKAVN